MLSCLLTSLGLLPNSDNKTQQISLEAADLVTNGKSAAEVTFSEWVKIFWMHHEKGASMW
jgi:hypothetical protein